jgi:hypothetical protein
MGADLIALSGDSPTIEGVLVFALVCFGEEEHALALGVESIDASEPLPEDLNGVVGEANVALFCCTVGLGFSAVSFEAALGMLEFAFTASNFFASGAEISESIWFRALCRSLRQQQLHDEYIISDSFSNILQKCRIVSPDASF